MAQPGKKANVAHKINQDPREGSGQYGLLLFIGSFCLFALSSSPAIGWLDSPEFVAQAATLGIAHSPGHPLPALLGRFASLIPLGDIVWRVNLMSSLCAAATVSVLFHCGVHLLQTATWTRLPQHRQRLAFVFAGLVAVSWAFWANAVRAEVYSLQALLTVSGILAVFRYLRTNHPSDFLVAAFVFALGLANHHLLTLVVFLPSALVILAHKHRPSLRRAGFSVAIGMTGLCALLYLPVRSLTHPLVNFGAPHTLDRFYWTLSGAAFSKSLSSDHLTPPLDDFFAILIALSSALSLPVLLLAIFGGLLALNRERERSTTLLLVLISTLCITVRVMLGFESNTTDHHAYLFPAIVALALLALSGLAHLCSLAIHAKRPLPSAPAIATFALALVLPISLWSNWERTNHAQAYVSDDIAHWEIDSLPPYSLVLTAYFQTTFRQWALSTIEGSRPDIVLLDRSFLSYPGMDDEAKRRNPELTALIDAPLRPGYDTPLQLLSDIADRRPVFVQQNPNVDSGLARELVPAGPFAAFRPMSGEQERADDADKQQRLDEILRNAGGPDQYETLHTLLWHDATRLDLYCVIGDKAGAQRVLDHALSLAPQDELLKETAIRCRLTQ